MSSINVKAALCALALAGCTSYVSGSPTDDGEGSGPDAGPSAADAGPGDPEVCEADFAQVDLEPVSPTVELVIDQSGSMHRRFGQVTRWEAMRHALVDETDGVVPRLDDEVFFGATLYHGITRQGAQECVTEEVISAQADNHDAIADLLWNEHPSGDTPTAAALEELTATFEPAVPESRQVVVLATDGYPDNCADPDAHTLYSQILTENAAEHAHAEGIELLVLSIGDQMSETHLQRLANAGQGEPLHVGDAPYYVARDPDELAGALDDMIGSAIPTCKFTLPWDLTLQEAQTGRLELDGRPLEYGVDWQLADASTLELLDTACDRVLTDPQAQLSGELPCP